MAILCEFKGCIKYALLQIQIRGENPNTQIAESVSPPAPPAYIWKALFRSGALFSDILHFIPLHYTLLHFFHVQHCSSCWQKCVWGHWGFQYVNLTSSRLLSRLRSTTTSGPFNWPISLGLICFSVTILASSFHFHSLQYSYLGGHPPLNIV